MQYSNCSVKNTNQRDWQNCNSIGIQMSIQNCTLSMGMQNAMIPSSHYYKNRNYYYQQEVVINKQHCPDGSELICLPQRWSGDTDDYSKNEASIR